MKLFYGLVLGLGFFSSAFAHANTCELKVGYYVNCSGGAAITLINGVEVGGCEWFKAAVAHVRALKAAGACDSIRVINTDCEIPIAFHRAAQREQDRLACYAKSNHL